MLRKPTLFIALAAVVATLLPAAAAAPAVVPAGFSSAAKAHLAKAVKLEPNENALNVVYFLGSDREPVADYERRISELLIHLQQYYAAEMARNGFGRRAFGLIRKPDGMVDILVIRGRQPATEYSYEKIGGSSMAEIEEFFAAHPEKKHSSHTFVIMPTFYDDTYHDESPGGVPFFGYGTYCFALDYAHFDLRYLGEDSLRGRLLTKWYGGFAHELGHGLNLPHNNGTASQNAALGTALMNSGNYTFGMAPTYLTKATCAILDRSETFARRGDKTAFYGERQNKPRVSSARLRYKRGALQLSFLLSGQCDHINAYVQDPPYVVNQDYDAVAFTAKIGAPRPDGTRRVTLTIPRAELSSLKKDQKQLSIYFIQHDGNRYRWDSEFSWSGVSKDGSIPLNPEQPHDVSY